jgi:hypothetical protein
MSNKFLIRTVPFFGSTDIAHRSLRADGHGVEIRRRRELSAGGHKRNAEGHGRDDGRYEHDDKHRRRCIHEGSHAQDARPDGLHDGQHAEDEKWW